jgi:hypothetical protein
MERDLDSFRRELADIHDRLLDLLLAHIRTSLGDDGIDGEFTDAINRAIDAGIGIDESEAMLEEFVAQMQSSR